MKKAVIGGFLSIVGAIGIMAALISTASSMTANVNGWSTPPGRFLSWMSEIGMSAVLTVSSIILLVGLIIMGVEYFRKENR